MNRKQKQKQIKKLQAQCEIIKRQAQIDINNIKKHYSEREDCYCEYIQILLKRLLDGKHYVTERGWIVFIRDGETHIGLYAAYKAEREDIVAARNVSYIGALISYHTVKNRHKLEK